MDAAFILVLQSPVAKYENQSDRYFGHDADVRNIWIF